MRPLAPTSGIAMCQSAVAVEERLESALGYKRLFSGAPSDFRCRPESRPSWGDVRFPAGNVSFTPESRPGVGGRFSSAVDPKRSYGKSGRLAIVPKQLVLQPPVIFGESFPIT